ncbi:hypothetical protein PMAYCL1PPCAC_11919, partial [Pristionchus mayeri]
HLLADRTGSTGDWYADTNKSIPKQHKIIIPDTEGPVGRYKRTPIDFSQLDSVGHGTRSTEQTFLNRSSATMSRAISPVSGNNSNITMKFTRTTALPWPI